LGVGSFPVAERCANEFLSLPMFPELTPVQIDTVVREVKSSVSALPALSLVEGAPVASLA